MSAVEKVSIVTGASQGIGAGIVRQLLARGYGVVACSRKVAATNQPNLVEVAGDISQPETAARIIQTAKERFGRVDTLINNPGAFLPTFTEAGVAPGSYKNGINVIRVPVELRVTFAGGRHAEALFPKAILAPGWG